MKLAFSRKARMDRIFEGYEKRVTVDENGKEKVKFVYLKEYFSPKMTEKNYILTKILYVVLFLISVACQLYSGLKVVPMNLGYKFMGFSQCIAILGLIIVAIYIGSKLTAPFEMEIYAYKNSHDKLIIAANIATCMILLPFVTGIVTMIMAKAVTFGNIIWALLYLIAAAVIFAIRMVESRTDFDILPPKAQ